MGRSKKLDGKRNLCCVVPGYKSDSRKNINKHQFMENVEFYAFPTKKKNMKLRRKWLQRIERPLDYDPKPWHRVCSRHFVGGMLTEENNTPELFPKNNYKQPTSERSDTSIKKREILTPVRPSNKKYKEKNKETCGVTETVCIDLEDDENAEQQTQNIYTQEDFVKNVPYFLREIEVKTEEDHVHVVPKDHQYCLPRGSNSQDLQTSTLVHDFGSQTDVKQDFIENLENNLTLANKKLNDTDTLLREMFLKKVTKNDKSISFYTGLPSLHMLNGLFSILDKYETKLKYWSGADSSNDKHNEDNENLKPGPKRKLSRYHEYILTLIRLRQALPENLLSDLFGVSISRISQIFTTWIFYMNTVFKDLILWPSKEVVKKHTPAAFKKSYPNIRAIIDCTELFIQRPRNPSTQARTYSNYKSHNTYKCLVSITPNGGFNFISDLYGGNTSDRYITEHSGFLDKVSKGDNIMADRGFLIRDLLLERKAYLTIPPFTKKCSWGKGRRLCASQIRATRKIANVRIYVEQAIQRLKKFKMLSQILLWTQKPLVRPMMIVAGFICNLMKPLVKK